MPELPEVEVIRLFLQDNIINRQITAVQVLNPKSFIGNSSKLIGESVKGIGRLGKQLTIRFTHNIDLLFHLKMTGQIIYVPLLSKGETQREGDFVFGHPTPALNRRPLPNKFTQVIFTFDNNSRIFFNDQRQFGWIRLMTPQEVSQFQSDLGVDILDSAFTPEYLYEQLHTSRRAVKLVLLDQHKFAGIGNIYANDALFLSRIHPALPANRVTLSQARKLHRALIDIIYESISHGGSTAADNTYIHPDGTFGSHQYHFRVYQKEGEPCPICGGRTERFKQSGRSTFFCPRCQPPPT